ncbi:Transmembrane protein 14C [Cricetulus griseus]|uniref:Transmembrane protein 14C n=1 Tax=Cricetulus griseus TaxID=10029 RepID=G3HST4_CRIGR|nr:Transmembrane protein 14C [Cricetulus griseus]
MQKDSGPLVPLHYLGFGYAALVATGGIIGYAKAGSVPSLAAGLFFGSLAGYGAYQLSQDPRNVWVFLEVTGFLITKDMASDTLLTNAVGDFLDTALIISRHSREEHAEESTILPGFVGDDDDLVDDDDDDRCLITRSFDVQSEPAVSKRGWEKMVPWEVEPLPLVRKLLQIPL